MMDKNTKNQTWICNTGKLLENQQQGEVRGIVLKNNNASHKKSNIIVKIYSTLLQYFGV